MSEQKIPSEEQVERVLGQARDVLKGEANGDWRADWPYEWAEVLLLIESRRQVNAAAFRAYYKA